MRFNAYENTANEAQARAALAAANEALKTCKSSTWSSAAVCAADAGKFLAEGKYGFAHEWACESLAYSVGMFSPIRAMHVANGRA